MRYFDRVHAIAVKDGVLETAIGRFKYNGSKAWGQIFARVLLGFLEENRPIFGGYTWIVASPAHLGPPPERDWHPARLILEEAARIDERGWPFHVTDPQLIVKTVATTSMVRAGTWPQRLKVATEELRPSLAIPSVPPLNGTSVLVFDDVFTNGQTMNEVARCLRLSGHAARVDGIVIARAPFRG